MVVPFIDQLEVADTSTRLAVVRKELETLQTDIDEMDKFRSYYNGEQELVFSTALFQEVFGSAFEGFSDNWMRPIVDAVMDHLHIEGIGGEDREFANRIQTLFALNQMDLEQQEIHEGLLVESKAFAIVWPDSELGVRVDWQPGQLCRVRYEAEDRRRPKWAVKRFEAEDGAIYVTFYTKDAIFKFVEREPSDSMLKGSSSDALTEIPNVGWVGNMVRREVEGEPWPLPNLLGRVPVVEFNNTSFRSELADAVTQQDALNKTLMNMMVTGEFQAFSQRYVETVADAPEDGWLAGPGEVWHFKPTYDPEGRPITSQFGEFKGSDPGVYVKVVEMFLQHIAFTSRTPVRYFLQSDRGGRGDAPSGDSLKIEDQPLHKKVERKVRRIQESWRDLIGLMALADSKTTDKPDLETIRTLPIIWKDPRYEHRMALLEEAKVAKESGLPMKWIVRQLGLSPEERTELEEWIEEEETTRDAREMAKAESLAEINANNQPPPNTNGPPRGN